MLEVFLGILDIMSCATVKAFQKFALQFLTFILCAVTVVLTKLAVSNYSYYQFYFTTFRESIYAWDHWCLSELFAFKIFKCFILLKCICPFNIVWGLYQNWFSCFVYRCSSFYHFLVFDILITMPNAKYGHKYIAKEIS